MLPGIGAKGGFTKIPASASKITATEISVSGGTGTHSSGVSAGVFRIVAVVFTHEETNLMSACTLAGITATKAFGVNPAHAQRAGCELWYAVIPAGTSGDIVISGDDGIYAFTSYSVFNAGVLLSADSSGAAANPLSLNVTLPAGSVTIAGANNVSGSGSFVWANATEDTDYTPGGAWAHSTATRADAAATTANITATSGTTGNGGGAAVFGNL